MIIIKAYETNGYAADIQRTICRLDDDIKMYELACRISEGKYRDKAIKQLFKYEKKHPRRLGSIYDDGIEWHLDYKVAIEWRCSRLRELQVELGLRYF